MTVLPIFPTAGFDQSATTPVLLGVLVSWAFTEAFGWAFAGLVVPGYLAALFLLDPRAATIDVFEAIVTYAIARALGEHLGKTGLTSRLFGRERFFLVVLVSILVRLGVEGALFPRLVPHATWAFSIGLVVVPLTANACWKTGLARGLVQNGVPTLIVFVLLRFVLVPYTNLSLASFDLATENIAASFLGSPKAYIVLLSGAVLAAFANLRYGWDYSGILIPALLGLVVIHPMKLVATIAEVLVLLAVTRFLLLYTPMRTWNVEGARRPVLFFTIDYALRLAFAWVLGRSLPGSDVIDLMGFGYLLPTLLAVKASQKQLTSLVVLPAMAVAGGAFVLGTSVGFAARAFDPAPDTTRAPVQRPLPAAPSEPAAAALWVAALARPAPAKSALDELAPARVAALVDELAANPDAATPPHLASQRLDQGVVLLRERFETLEKRAGDPAVLARAGARQADATRLVALVDAPVGAPESAAWAGKLLADRVVDAVVVAGAERGPAGLLALAPAESRVARALADARRGRGLVVAFGRARDGRAHASVAASAVHDPRLVALLAEIQKRAGDLDAVIASTDQDARIDLPLDRIASWLPPPAPASLAGSTALATLAHDPRAPAPAPSIEEVLALRRLVLEPLLATGATDGRLPLMRLAAQALGYVLHGPAPLGDGELGLALVAGEAHRPLAVVARTRAARGLVVEAPHGAREGVRDLAIRLGGVLRADAIIIGFAHGTERWLGDASVREALALATSPALERPPRIVLVHEPGDVQSEVGRATLSTWGGGDVAAFAAEVRGALDELGLPSSSAPLDAATRDGVGRSVFGETSLVAVAVDPRAQRAASLEGARAAARAFAAFPIIDAECPDAALALARDIPASGPTAPADLRDVVTRAAAESSIVARRALEAVVASGAAKAALARASGGVYLVAVARGDGGAFDVIAIPISPLAPHHVVASAEPTVAACAARVSVGGACRAERP